MTAARRNVKHSTCFTSTYRELYLETGTVVPSQGKFTPSPSQGTQRPLEPSAALQERGATCSPSPEPTLPPPPATLSSGTLCQYPFWGGLVVFWLCSSTLGASEQEQSQGNAGAPPGHPQQPGCLTLPAPALTFQFIIPQFQVCLS